MTVQDLTDRHDKQRGEPTAAVHTAALGEFVSALTLDAVPEHVRAHAKLDILDTLGCALFGRGLPIADVLEKALQVGDSAGGATVWGGGSWRTSPATAAFVNGTLAHSFELDDLHHVAILHPGGTTLPATAAVAEVTGSGDGADLLTAHIAGLEVSSRVGLAVGVPLLMRGWHNNGVLGVFGAASGAARVQGLSAVQSQHAIGIAGSLACGLMAAQYGAMVKRAHAGNAAQVGVRAGLLAAQDFTGIEAIFEEPYGGFLSTFADDHVIDELSKDLGTRWETVNVGFKPYSSCGSTHSTVDTVLKLQREHGFRAGEITRVRVGASTATRDHVGWRYVPDQTITAQMNLSYAASVALIDGECFVDQFVDSRLRDPEILELASKFEITGDPEIDAGGRSHRHEVKVLVELADGRELRGHTDAAPGSAVHPLSPDTIRAKFMNLAGRRVGERNAAEILRTVENLEELTDLGVLWRLLANN
ncbi:MmgE/PrpD family protein [Amycolatopsis acidicola]|uniref:MmgE/PrpD family protein n=1 Tax=Amycolatopsis acidicola TaxID=2596893 RepID=UPI00140BEFE7|nr:MmgE/PrpD family protein [Amycolatopsis acidicola]